MKTADSAVDAHILALGDIEKKSFAGAYDNLVVNKDKNIIGEVTSGTQSPSLVKGIGLGYVDKSYSNLNTQIGIIIRNKIFIFY